jgi:hypothetical protein
MGYMQGGITFAIPIGYIQVALQYLYAIVYTKGGSTFALPIAYIHMYVCIRGIKEALKKLGLTMRLRFKGGHFVCLQLLVGG